MFSVAKSENCLRDRFIPLRVNMHVDLYPKTESGTSELLTYHGEKIINCAKIRYNRVNYQNALREVLFPLETRVLNFFPPKQFTPRPFSLLSQTWPVKPRKKPMIDQPEMILDMPEFDSDLCHHVADWSSKNCLATIFENEVHMWYSDNQFNRIVTNTQRRVQCCVKWAQDGERFAVSLCPNKIGIWNVKYNKFACEEASCCVICKVHVLEWIDDTFLVSGCDHGKLRLFNFQLKKQKKLWITHKHSIINIVRSSDKKRLAVSATNKIVSICTIPAFEVHHKIKCSSIVRALAWHPWSGSILAIGHGQGKNLVSLWKVSTCKEIASEKTYYVNSEINALAFNPISGELVVSYFVPCENTRHSGNGIISVLSSIDKVVEELHAHSGPILYLLWGDEGKVLASVSADENLFIWNFFGAEKQKEANVEEDSFSRFLSIR